MSHIIDPTTTEGGQEYSKVSDANLQQIMIQVLMELKKINLHLEELSELQLQNTDVEI